MKLIFWICFTACVVAAIAAAHIAEWRVFAALCVGAYALKATIEQIERF